MEPHFKIITPVYNADDWIGKCISSVKQQTYSNYHQIIIDDSSTDNTFQVARELVEGDDRFSLYTTQQRNGVPINQKRGVELSNANLEDVIVHLDGDDWFYDETVLDKVAKLYDEKDCW